MTTSGSAPRDGFQRNHWPALAIAGVTLLAVVVVAASSGDEAVWTATESTTAETVEERSPGDVIGPSSQRTDEPGARLPSVGPEFGAVAALLLLAAVLLAVATIPSDLTGWSWTPGSRRRRRRASSMPIPMTGVARAVEADDVAVLAAIREGPPRNAIVRCWTLLEQDAADAGMPRAPEETSSEYVERVIGASSVDPQPIADLGALFREARFSSRPIDETKRERAEEALERTLASLAGRTEQRS